MFLRRKLQYLLIIVGLCSSALAMAQNCDSSIKPSTPTGNFSIFPDGTVTDNTTGLMWPRCVLGQRWNGTGCDKFKQVASFRDWENAVIDSNRSDFAGYEDWRLPTLEELRTLVEHRCQNPSINTTVFPNASQMLHWTQDSFKSSAVYAWRISFEDGSENADLKQVTSYVARPVRGEMKPKKEKEQYVIEPLDKNDSESLRLERSKLLELGQDGIHDIENPDIGLLQKPAESMASFSRNKWGRVDWIRVLQSGDINPKSGVHSNEPMLELELDILMKDTGSMDYVKFPHKQHTQWLACKNCHTKIFPYKAGLVDIKMDQVLRGEYCGLCHGKVAFSPMLCERCHSVPKK